MMDICKITIQSGKGGDGVIAFDNNRKADGGDGGHGGDIYIVGDLNVYDLTKVSKAKNFVAQNGQNGQKQKQTGKHGEDIEIHVPLITKIYNGDDTEIFTMSQNSFKLKILEGGKGGLGNYTLRGEGWEGKLTRTKGEESSSKELKLELNLKADAIFLGYPNAGKSSIVNSLSNAKYKVAPYEFTTLNPQLAVMDSYLLMDLPGLIEGAHKGKGLGMDFVKHTKYSKLLVHCISLENSNLMKTYKDLKNELLNISEDLYSLPELIVFTKADIYSYDQMKKVERELEKDFKDFVVMSVFRKENVENLKKVLKERLSSISNTTIQS